MKTITVCGRCGGAHVTQSVCVNVNTGEESRHDDLFCVVCEYDGHDFPQVEVPDDFDARSA